MTIGGEKQFTMNTAQDMKATLNAEKAHRTLMKRQYNEANK